MDAERRQVTILFADMVGFTSFSHWLAAQKPEGEITDVSYLSLSRATTRTTGLRK
jgi:class 3 adenylate cyclase